MVVEKRTSHHHSHRKKFSLSVKSVYSLWPCQAPAILISTSSFRAIIIHGSTTRTLCPARVSPKFLIELPFFLCFFTTRFNITVNHSNRSKLHPLMSLPNATSITSTTLEIFLAYRSYVFFKITPTSSTSPINSKDAFDLFQAGITRCARRVAEVTKSTQFHDNNIYEIVRINTL